MAHLPSGFTDMFQYSGNMQDAGQSETKLRKEEGLGMYKGGLVGIFDLFNFSVFGISFLPGQI